MSAVAYTVVATLPDEGVASEYIAWLESGHVSHVVAAGAGTGMIVRISEPASPIQVETRYVFPNRAVYEAYIRDYAPTLRAEGLRRFGPDRGVRFERRVGVVV